MGYVLGINAAYHQPAAALLDPYGAIVAFAEDERFTRKKHGKQAVVEQAGLLPEMAISEVLSIGGVKPSEIESIAYSLHPERRFYLNSGLVYEYNVTEGQYGTDAGEAKMLRLIHDGLSEYLERAGFKVAPRFIQHHQTHALSSLIPSPFDEAGVMVVDGIGEFEATSLYYGSGGNLKLKESWNFPNSIGFVWERVADFLGFSIYGACKAMGLASYGDPKPFRALFEKVIFPEANGYRVDDSVWQLRGDSWNAFEEYFGLSKLQGPPSLVNPSTKPYADMAATLQQVTEELFIHLVKSNFAEVDNICLSGGVALNCVANGKLAQRFPGKSFYIYPAAHDAGTALGAAYAVAENVVSKNSDPYLGPEYDQQAVMQVLEKHEELTSETLISDQLFGAVAQMLADGKVVSWFQGRMEVGPRALGNRSILADPRNPWMVDHLNQVVKHRERFRPFCPSVMAEHVHDWFEVPYSGKWIAKYMLGAFHVRNKVRDLIPAVVHVDGTCRVQTVSVKDNPRYHQLLEKFYGLTGCPVLLNTSFNDSEPIVCSPEDAVRTFLSTSIDVLVINNVIVKKTENWRKNEISA